LHSFTQGVRHASLTVTGLLGSTTELCHGKLGYQKWERKEKTPNWKKTLTCKTPKREPKYRGV